MFCALRANERFALQSRIPRNPRPRNKQERACRETTVSQHRFASATRFPGMSMALYSVTDIQDKLNCPRSSTIRSDSYLAAWIERRVRIGRAFQSASIAAQTCFQLSRTIATRFSHRYRRLPEIPLWNAACLYNRIGGVMKSLLFALILALGMTQAYAQQEVDPDHFDQPASHVAARSSQHGHLTAQHRHQRSRVHLASKHGVKSHHHHAHASA